MKQKITITGYCFIVSSQIDYDYETTKDFSEKILICLNLNLAGDRICYKGDSKHLIDWCKEKGLEYKCVTYNTIIDL